MCVDIHGTQCCRGLENQLISNNRKQIIQRYSTEEADTLDTGLDYDYLLGMPMWSLTKERKDDLIKKKEVMCNGLN